MNRIGYIDGLRAVAVLAVVAAHTQGHVPGVTAQGYWEWGDHGVDLFFVLSGFCLAYPTLRRRHEQGSSAFDLAGYAIRRVLRIVPPYYGAIALFLALVLAAPHVGLRLPWPTMLPYGLSAGEVLKQALFYDRHTSFLNGSFWTLCIEFRWYWYFPIMLWLWMRAPLAFAAFGVLCVPLFLMYPVADLAMLPAFLLGIVAAEIAVRNLRGASVAFCAMVALGIVAFATHQPRIGSLVWETICFCIVVVVGSASGLRRLFAMRCVVFIGTCSYSIYLLHEPVIAMMEARGLAPWVAGILGVSMGVGFWCLIERHFAATELRDHLARMVIRSVRRSTRYRIPAAGMTSSRSE